MSASKIAITIDTTALRRVDRLVRRGVFPKRSRAIQQAVNEKLDRLERRHLAEECAKLDPVFEQSMADEGLRIAEAPAEVVETVLEGLDEIVGT